MIVIKPIEIDDSNLTSSTIAEPDPLVGEVEWIDLPYVLDIGNFAHQAIATDGTYFYVLRSDQSDATNKSTVTKFDIDFNVIADFPIDNATASVINDATIDGAFLYLSGSSLIYEYNLGDISFNSSFAYTGGGFCVGVSSSNGVIYTISSTSELNAYVGGVIDAPRTQSLPGPALTFIGKMAYENGFFYVANLDEIYRYVQDLTLTSIVQNYDTLQAVDVDLIKGLASLNGFQYVLESQPFQVATISKVLFGTGIVDGLSHDEGEIRSVSSAHKIYVSVVENNDNPVDGAAKDTQTWVYKQPTNKYSMFDDVVGTRSVGGLSEIIEITPSEIVGGLAVINMIGVSAVNVMMTDPIDGVVYNRDIDMVDNGNIVDWYQYLWGEFNLKTEFVILDLPPYKDATTKLTFTGVAEIGVGVVKTGPVVTLGTTNYGTNVQQLDLNQYKYDDFGNETVIQRPYAKLVNFKNTVLKENLTYVYRQLEELRGVSAVWVGDETNENDLTLVYGTHRDNTLNIDSPTACTVPLQIRGKT